MNRASFLSEKSGLPYEAAGEIADGCEVDE